MDKQSLKQFFIQNDMSLDCQYLDKYLDLIFKNQHQKYIAKKTQSHHIIPRSYYELNGLEVDNSKHNIVNLFYGDHVLAHYYLAMSSRKGTEYARSNFCAIYHILGHKNFPQSEKEVLSQLSDMEEFYENQREALSKFNVMNDVQIRGKHDLIMKSDAVRNSISSTIKRLVQEGVLFNEDHRRKLSESAKGRVCLHKGEEEIRTKDTKEVETLLSQGWQLGGAPITDDHIEALRRSHFKQVYCVDESGKEVARFNSVIEADKWWFNNGYISAKGIKPKDYHSLSDIIKKSSKEDRFISGLKWFYVEGGDSYDKVS